MIRTILAAAAIALLASAFGLSASADVVISGDATQNMSCSGGVCAPTATDAVLNVTDLENLLVAGSVSVVTMNGSVQATNIDVTAALTWSSANTLVLDAYQSITFTGAMSVAGTGGLSLAINHGSSGGTLLFGAGGSADFASLSSPLTINGAVYTLVDNITTLASAIAANPSGHFALANNYDASADGTYSNSPVATTVQGTIEGLGNAISNLSIVPKSHKSTTAFMGEVLGTVENLQLQQIHYRCRRSACNLAGLVSENQGILFNDKVSGSIVTNSGDGGGLVWDNNGENYYASIISCAAAVRIDAKQGNAAGLVVLDDNHGNIELSQATGNIVASSIAGGLVGSSYDGFISESFATGSVSAGTAAGGLIGVDVGYVDNSYSRGAVSSAGANAGGFVGSAGEEIAEEYSYSTGKVSLGGFACFDSGIYTKDDYWDTTTSGTQEGTCDGNVDGISGLTSHKLRSGLPAGFDPAIWAEDANINNGFPYLIANPPAQ